MVDPGGGEGALCSEAHNGRSRPDGQRQPRQAARRGHGRLEFRTLPQLEHCRKTVIYFIHFIYDANDTNLNADSSSNRVIGDI